MAALAQNIFIMMSLVEKMQKKDPEQQNYRPDRRIKISVLTFFK